MKPKLFETLDKLNAPEADDFYAHCQVGHDHHATKVVWPSLDYTGAFAIEVYDWQQYFTTVAGNETTPKYAEYCTGQDIISYCIDRQGIWEKEETAVMLQILQEANADKLMLDFGSHIGWYSLMALKLGYRVASLDASQENLDLLRRSAAANGGLTNSYPYLCWLDNDSPALPADAEEVHLVKVDVEGAEHHALRMITPLLEARKVKYAIFEISPVFNGNYPALVSAIEAYGYDIYQLPSLKPGDERDFKADPLGFTLRNNAVKHRGVELTGYIDGLHQENFLFVRREQ